MAELNFLGGVRAEIHDIKKTGGDDEGYEPSIVIFKETKKGTSFIIPLSAMWKYIDPYDNQDEVTVGRDFIDFNELVKSIERRRAFAVTHKDHYAVNSDMACVLVAKMFNKGMKFLLCTGYNLAKCMQILDISLNPQAAAQLLLFIQDALDDLRKHKGDQPESEFSVGEVRLFESGNLIAEKEMTITESELLETEGTVE